MSNLIARIREYLHGEGDHDPRELLREVAALEPVAYLVHGGRCYVDAAYIDERYAQKRRAAQQEDGARLSPLYTITGSSSHDPEAD